MLPIHRPEPGPGPARSRPSLLALIAADPRAAGARHSPLAVGDRLTIDDGAQAPVMLLASGRAAIAMPTAGGVDVFLTDLLPGEIVGEGAALDAGPTTSIVTVESAGSAWVLTRAQFRRRAMDCPDFALAAMDAMCRRLERISLRLAEASTPSTRDRIHAELLRLADAPGRDAPGGDAPVVKCMVTHQAFAARAGTQREAVTKELSRLRRLGVIELSGRTLSIRNPDRLGPRGA
ncbi:Crp/Fnr family transcriptional regulator [Lichenibacterium minor]|uniref:Crp/Fnr family transcriptional regulator n=1 Tax=Lichenibacterium minor TaxID=2316528 RepID=A0A4Q2U475_9HYPH|nr:Crp/Fnr family transcriptional regulator [Lichenibacterium minor]RYC31333.1 Crp/Fnr family transcriptional regulator [Lichenibacterium minor]